MRKSLIYISLLVVTVLHAQRSSLSLESQVDRLSSGVTHAFKRDITPGTRLFVLRTNKDEFSSSILRDHMERKLLDAFQETKFEVVYQPFLVERTIKQVESTDSSFVLSTSSTYNDHFRSMRALQDSLMDYNVDLLLQSNLFYTADDILILEVSLIDVRTLEVKSGYTFYGRPFLDKEDVTYDVSVSHGLSRNANVYRSYGAAANLTIGPYEDDVYSDAIELNILQKPFEKFDWLSAGLFLGAQRFYVNDFTDVIYNINDFKLTALSLGTSVSVSLINADKLKSFWILNASAGISKLSLEDNYYFLQFSTEVKLNPWLGLFFGTKDYVGQIGISDPYLQSINLNNIQLCGGVTLHL